MKHWWLILHWLYWIWILKIKKEKQRKGKQKMNEWIGNNIGDEGAKKISEALMINTTLTELNLYCDDKDRKTKKE